MEFSFHSHLNSNTVIATKFCTWHDSCAVVACAKICCDLMASNGVMTRRSFHRIWIAGKKSLVKRAPDHKKHNGHLMSRACQKAKKWQTFQIDGYRQNTSFQLSQPYAKLSKWILLNEMFNILFHRNWLPVINWYSWIQIRTLWSRNPCYITIKL